MLQHFRTRTSLYSLHTAEMPTHDYMFCPAAERLQIHHDAMLMPAHSRPQPQPHWQPSTTRLLAALGHRLGMALILRWLKRFASHTHAWPLTCTDFNDTSHVQSRRYICSSLMISDKSSSSISPVSYWILQHTLHHLQMILQDSCDPRRKEVVHLESSARVSTAEWDKAQNRQN
jgi:hypothetical protein